MDLIGKTTIHPILFYTGKTLGYITWIILLLLIMRFEIVERISLIYNDYISYLISSIGIVFIVFSLINLGRSTRLGLPTEKTVLKTNGLYRISRNPMYVGFNLLTISAMVYTLNGWVVFIGIYSLIIYHLIIIAEEKFLENQFGEQYRIYKKRIRRYL